MALSTILCSLGCFIRGHAPIVEINEAENKAQLVCERCRAALGDFVRNLHKHCDGPTPMAQS
jgi:hypothetical protein